MPAGLSNIVTVAGGGSHSAALRNDGTVVAWGYNSYGQTNVPAGLSNVVALAAGDRHNLALSDDGTIVAWGFNYYGQTNVPADLTNVVALAAGAITAWPCGTTERWWPGVTITTVKRMCPRASSNAVAVAAGGSHSLALRSDGTVEAWGRNTYGQVDVPADLTNAVAIAGGAYHSLALRSDGTVEAWGRNNYGQTNVPVGLSNVVAIAGGDSHSLALRDDGTLVAWGYNYYGQTNNPSGSRRGRRCMLREPATTWPSTPAVWPTRGSSPCARDTTASGPSRSRAGKAASARCLSSTNLQQWTPLATITNPGGRILWTDPGTNQAHCFYRMRQLP